MMSSRFNVRVYGILLSEGKVLVCDEMIRGRPVTKFPGGGLELGEGIRDCLLREFREELDLEIAEISHLYTTDFFVASAFDDSQVISIYYLVKPADESKIHSLSALEGSDITSLRWLSIPEMSEGDLTLVIDRHVAGIIRTRFSNPSHESV